MNNFDDCSWDKPNVTMPDKVNIYRSQAGSFVAERIEGGGKGERRT